MHVASSSFSKNEMSLSHSSWMQTTSASSRRKNGITRSKCFERSTLIDMSFKDGIVRGLSRLPCGRRFNERIKKRVRIERASTQFRMKLRAEHKGVHALRQFCDFHE